MIRREVDGEFFLITQNDHALLSGWLAGHVGNDRFAPPDPRQPALTGIAMHDAGWPLHDDEPTLNPRHLPTDVFETPRQIALNIWSASADRAAAVDPYSGLLASLHGLSLSVLATASEQNQPEKFEPSDLLAQFALNKFQHRQIELQETLRRRIGLRTDLPLKHGLAQPGVDKAEDRLLHNFRLLQALDLISLAICCTQPPVHVMDNVLPRPGDKPIQMKMQRQGNDLILNPWPFNREKLFYNIPFRRIPARTYRDESELRLLYRAADVEFLKFQIAARI